MKRFTADKTVLPVRLNYPPWDDDGKKWANDAENWKMDDVNHVYSEECKFENHCRYISCLLKKLNTQVTVVICNFETDTSIYGYNNSMLLLHGSWRVISMMYSMSRSSHAYTIQ
jgi:hypothetical protein